MSEKSILPISSNGGRTTEQQSPVVQEPKQEPISDAEQLRAEVEMHAAQTFIPANVFTEAVRRELEGLARWLMVVLPIWPLCVASAEKHPNDWNRILRLIHARHEIQPQIPRLKARYPKNPDLFCQRVAGLVRRRAKNIKLPKSAPSLGLPGGLSDRQYVALGESLSPLSGLLAGVVQEQDAAKKFLELFRSFAAAKPGPPPSDLTRKIREMWLAAPGRKPTAGLIAVALIPEYRTAESWKKRAIREFVDDVLWPLKQGNSTK
jgi:hypothetical protein